MAYSLYQNIRFIKHRQGSKTPIPIGISFLWQVVTLICAGIVYVVNMAHSNISNSVVVIRNIVMGYLAFGILFIIVLKKLASSLSLPNNSLNREPENTYFSIPN